MSSQDILVRLRMLGANAFNSSAKSASSAVRGIGEAISATDKSTNGFSKGLDKIAGPMATVGRLAGQASIALGAATTAAVGLGLKFNASMEQSQVAFTNLLGSSGKAKDMLDELYTIAAKTPFEFPQLTQSTQRLLGFGMAAKDVIPTMTAVGDAVAAAGGGADQIDRVSTALGQIQAKGKVSSEELLQLAESGVPALKILGDQLGLTGAQLSKKLQAGAISADKGIKALVTGMEKRYAGMAESQSKTFSGMISTLKDNAAQIMGKVTEPLFVFIRDKLLPYASKVTDAIGKWADAGGVQHAMAALQAGFSKGTGPATAGFKGMNAVLVKVGDIAKKAFTVFRDTFTQLMDALKPAMPFVKNILLPLLKGIAIGVIGSVVSAFKILIPLVKIVAIALGWIGQKAAPLRGVFEKIGIVIGVVFGPYILKLIGMLGKLGFAFKIIAGVAKVLAIPLRIQIGLFGVLFKVIGRLFGVFGRMAPIAKRAFDALVSPFKNIGKTFLEFGKAMITGIANGIKNSAGVILEALRSILPGGKVGRLIRAAIPGLARGGVIRRGGTAVVGERGPELATAGHAPVRITPMTIPPVAAMGGYGDVTIPVYLDGRPITTVVARRTADARARR